jgi:hypothetical protein
MANMFLHFKDEWGFSRTFDLNRFEKLRDVALREFHVHHTA